MIGLILGGVGVFILLFFYLASRKKYRDPSAAPNYTKIREKLTLREPEPEPEKEEEPESGGGFLGSIVGGFITILVGVSMLPIIMDTMAETTTEMSSSNVTKDIIIANSTLIGIVPLIFGIAILIAGLAIAASGLRSSGVL